MIAVGLMSGTSLDGIDAALIDISPRANGYALTLLRFTTHAFEPSLHAALTAILPPATGSVAELTMLHRRLGEAFGQAARDVAGTQRIDYVASHGQTVWHDGSQALTLQIGDPFAIRERTGATVCYDFRSADCAAGGHGAPLVPYVDALLLGSPHEHRATLNVGGIANVTLLPVNGEIAAFDAGPGNMLMDAFVAQRSGATLRFDRGGALAAAGTVNRPLLAAMLDDSYFKQTPPKTTGRERFGDHFLQQHHDALSVLSTEDGLSTLAEVTATCVAEAISASVPLPARLIVSGGGARNVHLLARIAARLPNVRVETSDDMGIQVEAKEAMAFAVLGYETLRGRIANVAAATGADRAVPLGAIAPLKLTQLLRQVERECACS